MDRDYTVFRQTLSTKMGNTVVVTRNDSYPGEGQFPTSGWPAGKILVDRQKVSLPPSSNDYPVSVATGLYYQPTAERLSAQQTDGSYLPDNAIVLGNVEYVDDNTIQVFVTGKIVDELKYQW